MPGGLAKDNGNKADQCCCRFRGEFTDSELTDDTTFLRNVATSVMQDVISEETSNSVTIDSKRIYMAGHSNGCIASIAMGTIHSDLVAAVCCHVGVAQAPFPASYQATPMWVVQGTSDALIPYDGRDFTLSAQESYENIANANGCTSSKTTDVANGDSTGRLFTSEGCVNNASVEVLTLDSVGHFPYYNENIRDEGSVPTLIDTTQLAWDFCSRHSLDDPPTATPTVAPTPSPPECNDSPLLMKQGESFQYCSWASEKSKRCRRSRVQTHCAKTCSIADCFVDSTKKFKLANGKEKDW